MTENTNTTGSPVQRINVEDLPDAPAWVSNLLSPINQFIQSTNSAISGNLQIPSNVLGQLNTVIFSTNSKYSSTDISTFDPIVFKSTLPYQTRVIMLGRLQIMSSQTKYIANNICISDWTDENGIISIKFISGLTPDTNYLLTTIGF